MTDDAALNEPAQPAPRRWVRGIRIGTSVFIGLLTVVLVVLWARSCKGWVDEYWLPLPSQHDFGITSVGECVSVAVLKRHVNQPYPLGWSTNHNDIRDKYFKPIRNPVPPSNGGFRIVIEHDYSLLYVNDWLLLVVFSGFALLPWLQVFRHFSLRTMLAVVTVASVLLGALVWAAAV
jgi:hypothetical protein